MKRQPIAIWALSTILFLILAHSAYSQTSETVGEVFDLGDVIITEKAGKIDFTTTFKYDHSRGHQWLGRCRMDGRRGV